MTMEEGYPKLCRIGETTVAGWGVWAKLRWPKANWRRHKREARKAQAAYHFARRAQYAAYRAVQQHVASRG